MSKLVLEFVAPTGAGKSYLVNQLVNTLTETEPDIKIQTRVTDNLDSPSTGKKIITRLRYIFLLVLFRPRTFIHIMQLINILNTEVKYLKIYTRLRLAISVLYNICYVIANFDQRNFLLLDQGPFQLLTSYAARGTIEKKYSDNIIDFLSKILPEQYYVVYLDYDIPKLVKNLRNRNTSGDTELTELYYGNKRKRGKTRRIFEDLYEQLNSRKKLLSHRDVYDFVVKNVKV